jgi:hypothetical protein
VKEASRPKLLRDRAGKQWIDGGTEADRAELKAWIAKFMPDIRIEAF